MLLTFYLLFFLCDSTVKSQSTEGTTPSYTAGSRSTAGETPSPVKLEANPDYPVAAGQNVHLQCSAVTMPASFSWFWQRLENNTWKVVSNGSDLTLTEPSDSGLYSCYAEKTLSQRVVSQNHTVFIVAMLPTVGENLGIAAFAFVLLVLIMNVAILFWLGWHKFCVTLPVSNTAKGLPGPQNAAKGSYPQTEDDGDVYINYRNTNNTYTDLDPANMAAASVYSTLS